MKKLLAMFAFCAFLVGLDALVVAPLVPTIAADLGFETAMGGLLVTAYGLLYGLSAPFFGPLSDRWGRKNLILLGLLVFSVGTALTALAVDLKTALLFRGVAGLGGAMLMPSVYAMIGDLFPYESRGRAMGMLMGAMIGSQILGVPAGTWLAKLGSWQTTFWIVAGLGMIALLVVWLGVPQSAPPRQLKVGPWLAYGMQFKTAFGHREILLALAGTFLWTAGLQGMFAYVGVYYDGNFGLTVERIGLIAMGAAAASVVGSVLGGRLADRFGKRRVIGVSALGSALGVMAFALLTESLAGAFAAQLIWAAFVGCGQAALTARISELSSQVRGTVLALNSSAMYIGMMTATAVSASLLAAGFGFLLIGVICAAATLLVLPAVSERKREPVL